MSIEINEQTGGIKINQKLRKEILCMKKEFSTSSKKLSLNIPKFKTFEQSDLFFNDVPSGSFRYKKKINPFETEGNPQMCLLLSEMYFIIKCIPKIENVTLIYLGAHPGDHINFLASFFENINFKVYDYIHDIPYENIMEKIGKDPYTSETGEEQVLKNIEKIRKIFTIEEAERIAELKNQGHEDYQNVYIISDIRNKSYSVNNSVERNSTIIDEDMYHQIRICQIIKPNACLLKFRPKIDQERLTFNNNLVAEEDPEDSKKLYFLYPKEISKSCLFHDK